MLSYLSWDVRGAGSCRPGPPCAERTGAVAIPSGAYRNWLDDADTEASSVAVIDWGMSTEGLVSCRWSTEALVSCRWSTEGLVSCRWPTEGWSRTVGRDEVIVRARQPRSAAQSQDYSKSFLRALQELPW